MKRILCYPITKLNRKAISVPVFIKEITSKRFFWVKGGGKALRKCAIRLAMATNTGLDFTLNVPARELIEINNEVAEEWERVRRLN